MRFTGRSVNNNLPQIQLAPLGIREAKTMKNGESVTVDFSNGSSDYLDAVQIIRKTTAVVANAEARYEINDNEIYIPTISNSKQFMKYRIVDSILLIKEASWRISGKLQVTWKREAWKGKICSCYTVSLQRT